MNSAPLRWVIPERAAVTGQSERKLGAEAEGKPEAATRHRDQPPAGWSQELRGHPRTYVRRGQGFGRSLHRGWSHEGSAPQAGRAS